MESNPDICSASLVETVSETVDILNENLGCNGSLKNDGTKGGGPKKTDDGKYGGKDNGSRSFLPQCHKTLFFLAFKKAYLSFLSDIPAPRLSVQYYKKNRATSEHPVINHIYDTLKDYCHVASKSLLKFFVALTTLPMPYFRSTQEDLFFVSVRYFFHQ
ncbi:Uncharacterised protein r2_g691 [Pycnogonum litorale]